MDLGDLIVSIRLRTEALEKGLQETQKKLQRSQEETKKAAAATKELEGSYLKASAVATIAFVGIVAAVMTGINAHNQYISVMKGFENQIKSTGQSVSEATKVMRELSSDGLMNESDAAAAIKNLVNYGFTIEKAKETLQALKDTAVDNRKTHFDLGEAVRVTTDGIRMENSVLSDAAGVQKNIAKMKEEYAKAIGKTTDALTDAEKAEAIYQGVMAESAANMGRAAEYAKELGGSQALLGASTEKLAQGFGAALAPILKIIIGIFQPLLDFVVSLVREFPELVAVITVMIATLAGLTAVIGAVTAAKISWAAATKTLGVALNTLLLNPIVLGLTALAGVVAFVTAQKAKAIEETKKLIEAEEEYYRVVRDGIQQHEINTYEERINELTRLRDGYQETKLALDNFEQKYEEANQKYQQGEIDSSQWMIMTNQLNELYRELQQWEVALADAGTTVEMVEKQIDGFTKALNRAKLGTVETINEQAKQIAMQNRELITVENLLKTYRSAEQGSSDWYKAQSELAKMFPQYSTAVGINADAIEGLLIVKRAETEATWRSVQAKAADLIMEKQRDIASQEATIKLLEGMTMTAAAVGKARSEIEKLKNEIVSLDSLLKIDPSQLSGIEPVVPIVKTGGSSAYQNKALDDAYRLLEHKKRLNQITTEDEIKTLEAIKAKHVKIAEERMGIEERLYDARSRVVEDYKKRQEDLLDRSIHSFQAAFEDILVREERTADQRFEIEKRMYDNIISENERYLQAVLNDDRYTADEKEAIQRGITEVIRQNVNTRLKLERDYYAEIRQQEINSINNLSQGIQSALREKYQAERTVEETRLRGLLDANEQWKRNQIEIVRSTYDENVKAAERAATRQIELINEKYNAQIKSIQDELAALDQAEKQKSRAELDAEDQRKIDRLNSLIDYEHDEFNKAQLQKELNKIITDQEKRHQKEQLDDKKEALRQEEKTLKEKLREETDVIKQQLAVKKEILQADREYEIQRINSIYEAQKTSLNLQVEAVRTHYESLLNERSLQAEAEKMIIENQQNEIIELLKSFSHAYNIAGQTLGEQMYQGFKDKVMQIGELIASLNSQIDAARKAALQVQSMIPKSGSVPAAGGQVGPTNVNIQNNFNSPVTSPSDVSRAAERTAQKLAFG